MTIKQAIRAVQQFIREQGPNCHEYESERLVDALTVAVLEDWAIWIVEDYEI